MQKGRRAALIWRLTEAPTSNILLQNVSIMADKPFRIYNAEDVRVQDCKIITPQRENKLSLSNAKVTVTAQ